MLHEMKRLYCRQLMLALLLSTILSSCFSLIIRFAQRRKDNLYAVGAVNYLTAAAFHGVWALSSGGGFDLETIGIGAFGGLSYSTAFLLILPFMRLRGVSVSAAMIRLSIVIPLGFALAVWGESVSALQAVGALLALSALPFLNYRPASEKGHLQLKAVLLLVSVFLTTGFCGLSVRWFHQTGSAGSESAFLTILFGTAALVMTAAWLFNRRGISPGDIPVGTALGLCNALGNRLLITALQQLPSILVYPFSSAVGLTMTVVFSWTVWGEKANRTEIAGISIAGVAVVLINIRLGVAG